MSGALAYQPDKSQAALVFQITEGSYNTESLICFLTDLHHHFGGEKITLIWDNLPWHKSKAMKAWIATQSGWLRVERLPGYAHDINPIEQVWATSNRSSWPTSARTPSTKPTPRPSPDCSASAPATTCASPSSPTPAFRYDHQSPNYRKVFNTKKTGKTGAPSAAADEAPRTTPRKRAASRPAARRSSR
jgi:transposase